MKKTPRANFVVIAWLVLIGLAYATLTRAGFVNNIYLNLSPVLMNPGVETYGFIVHVAAFVVLGSLFAVAYPRQLLLVAIAVIGAAIALEVLQTLTQDRHGTIIDALEKVAGGIVGIAAGLAVSRIAERRASSNLPCDGDR